MRKKTIFTLLFVLTITTLCFGQTKIEAAFPSFPNTNFSAIADQSSLNGYQGITLASGTTNDKGELHISFNISSERPIKLLSNNGALFNLWIIPNSILTIQEISEKGYIFSGQSEKENTFLYQSGLMIPVRQPLFQPQDILGKFEPKREFAFLDSIEERRFSLLNKYLSHNNISKSFESFCKAEIRSFTFFKKSQYQPIFSMMHPQGANGKNTPDNYYDFWKNFKLYDDSCQSDMYQNALRDYVQYKTLERIGRDKLGSETGLKETFVTMDVLLANHPYTMQKQKTETILFLIKYVNYPSLTENEVEKYNKYFPASPSLKLINSEWQKKHGSMASIPSFQLKDTAGNLVDIKDFRGKVVYIDFWGDWCKACLANMLYSEKVQQQFKGKDVTFLFIDFYDTKERWISAIKKRNINGFHVKAEKSDETYFDKVFNINEGFPRYALIDKIGKIITISAPQPSDKSLPELIEKYLE